VASGPVGDILRRDVLHDVYDTEFNMHEFDRCKVCLYFLPQRTPVR